MIELPIVAGRGRTLRVVAHTLVDPAPAESLATHEWRLHQGYVLCRSPHCAHMPARVFMHRLLLGLGEDDGVFYADHINRDRLDNRRENLRIVRRAENNQNLSPRTGTASRYRGVSWVTARNQWLARAFVAGKAHNRYCATEEEAAAAVAELRRVHMPFSEEAARDA